MFLPVTIDSAERIVETIQEIKEKIPSDPFEAELILMAEMVAEQDEKNNNKQERPKEKVVEKEMEKHEASAPDGERLSFFSVWRKSAEKWKNGFKETRQKSKNQNTAVECRCSHPKYCRVKMRVKCIYVMI